MIDEEVDIDFSSKFSKRQKERQDRETLTLLRQIVIELKKDDDKGLAEAISKNNGAVDTFLRKVEQLQKQELPDIKIENRNEEITKEIKKLGEEIKEGQDELIAILEKKPIRLKVNRDDYTSLITSVGIDYGLITYKK